MSINMDDVMQVLYNCRSYLIGIAVFFAAAVVVTAAVGKLEKPKRAFIRKSAWLAFLLAFTLLVNLICVGPMSTLLTLVSGRGTISEASSVTASELCVELAREGIVLLQNDNGLLPLESGSNLNVFGWASVSPVYGGTGSGGLSDSIPKTDLLTGLQEAGLSTNADLTAFYTAYMAERPALGYDVHTWDLPEPPATMYPQELLDGAKAFSDTALIVISRIGGEFADLPHDMRLIDTNEKESYRDNSDAYEDFPDGTHYLQPSQSERDMIQLVCDNFDRVIVVYNSANTLELGFVDDYPEIQSVIWCPGPGQTGFKALGEIVTGAVNPSGHAADTFVYDLTKAPYYYNIGDFAYTNADELSVQTTNLFNPTETPIVAPHFVNYVENIYVGYRFYETAAAEGLIDYDAYVQYPFGHGLSYTTFDQTMSEISDDGESVSFTVTVKNTGDVPGKDVVQIYANPPYTDGGIEKASANLVDFDKTSVLQPGEEEQISFTIPKEALASYDDRVHACYVLEAGTYVLSAGMDSHTPYDSQSFEVAEEIVYDLDNKRDSDAEAARNAFDFARGEIEYLSRAGHFANYAAATAAPATYDMPDSAKVGFYNSENYNPDDFNNPDDAMPVTGAKNGVALSDLRGLDYDDPLWDTLLDEMSVADMDNLIALGGYQTYGLDSIGKVTTYDFDGPANIVNNFTGVASIGFPSEVIIASTFNKELAEEFGDSIGTMADEMNTSGWYAPAMNCHRSAFDGRNFEYYSEDGTLAGKIAAASIRGAQAHGVYAYMKHFAMNEQQIAQNNMLCTWSTEQAIREIYLRPFELSVKDGDCKAVMSAWNYIGNQWAGACPQLLQIVLRNEWGFEGLVCTDGFHWYWYMDSDQAIRGGSDMMLKNFDMQTNHLTDQTSATGVLAMRNASHDIL
ncbi:MAG: glycoside hydrolase family 3 C-terminal domain-containing protein, partial [Oscillibacter sp.]|nr:glycoside hydrolase family 3 C-terminal domain-containing protein [Oscillibacter sp.]